jgi:hypothetical protein
MVINYDDIPRDTLSTIVDITKSNIVIFFINNIYRNTKRLLLEFHLAKKEQKPIIVILIGNENLRAYSKNKLIHHPVFLRILEPFDSDLNELLKQTQLFLLRAFNIDKTYFSKKIPEIKLVEKLKTQKTSMNYKFEIISNNESIILSTKTGVVIRNLKTGSLIGEINNGTHFTFHWIEHLQKILLFYNNSTQWAELYEKNGTFSELASFNDSTVDVKSFFYNHNTKDTYIVTSDRVGKYGNNLKYQNCMNYYKNYNVKVSTRFVFEWLNQKLNIYSIYFSFWTKIETLNPIYSIIIDKNQSLNFLIQTENSEILVYDYKTFNLIGSIKSPFKSLMYLNENIIFSNLSGISIVTRIELEGKDSRNKYKCYFNPNQPHIYCNPYLLPCGNSACLDCIQWSMNIFIQKFRCGCNEKQHSFDTEMKKNSKLNETMKENTHEILNEMLITGVEIMHKTGIKAAINKYSRVKN